MSRLISYEIIESDQRSIVKYTKKTINNGFLPLIKKIKCDYEKFRKGPYILGVAGPPGCGKSVISYVFKILFEAHGIEAHILPLDGFHLKDEELRKRKITIGGRKGTLYDRKGSKETYNVGHLIKLMGKLKSGESFYWPIYSRNTHNPIDKGILIEKPDAIYIVEGNYLFLDCEPWNSLRNYFDRKIFIFSKKRFLKSRIIKRKQKGGFSKAYARIHYKTCDSQNIDEVLNLSSGYDHLLFLKGSYRYKPGSL